MICVRGLCRKVGVMEFGLKPPFCNKNNTHVIPVSIRCNVQYRPILSKF